MSKEERKKRERKSRKQLILKAALKSFAKHGYHKSSMDLIAEEAELGKSTIYYYFPTKDELLLEVLKNGLEKFFENIMEKWKELENPLEKIRAVSEAAAEFFYENPNYFRLYLYLSIHPKLKQKTADLLSPIVESKSKMFIRVFREAQKEGLIKKTSPKELVRIFGALIMGAGIFGHVRRKSDLAKRMSLLTEIFFEGILLDKKR